MKYGDGLLNGCDGPADGLGELGCDAELERFVPVELGRGRLGIFEPSEGFSEGSLLAGLCALGGIGLYERVRSIRRILHRKPLLQVVSSAKEPECFFRIL